MRRYIDLDDYDFREVPDGPVTRLGESPTTFDENKVLHREEARLAYELEEPDDPFVLTDQEDDSWGASVLTLDDVEDLQRRGISLGGPGLGRWQPFKKLREKLRKVFDPVKIPGTTENLEENTRRNVDKALNPVWKAMVKGDKNNPSTLELLRRMQDFVASASAGKMPSFQVAPPAGDTAHGTAELVAATGGTPTMGWVTGVTTALQLGKGLMDSKYAERANKEIKKLDMAGIQAMIQDAAKSFVAVGGLLPQPGQAPPSAFVSEFQKRVQREYKGGRVKGDDKKRPKRGWAWYYIYNTGRQLKSLGQQMQKVAAAMKMALDAYKKTTMPKVVRACGNIAQKLLDKRVITLADLPRVVRLLHKHHQGYVLTDQERAVFERIAPYIGATTTSKLVAGAGTAAAATALLTML